jgi:hypothetical protein
MGCDWIFSLSWPLGSPLWAGSPSLRSILIVDILGIASLAWGSLRLNVTEP